MGNQHAIKGRGTGFDTGTATSGCQLALTRMNNLEADNGAPVPGKDRRRQHERDKVKNELKTLPQQELNRLIMTLEDEMHEASAELKFEYAARLRDEINELRREVRDAG